MVRLWQTALEKETTQPLLSPLSPSCACSDMRPAIPLESFQAAKSTKLAHKVFD